MLASSVKLGVFSEETTLKATDFEPRLHLVIATYPGLRSIEGQSFTGFFTCLAATLAQHGLCSVTAGPLIGVRTSEGPCLNQIAHYSIHRGF